MFKLPLPEIISKIKEATGLSDTEINVKIDDKLKQLSGLISQEGAAHIIANELGVKIFEQTSGKLQIKNILAGMRSVETVGKVTKKFELREFKSETREGKVASFVIGDETGTIRAVMWGDLAEKINDFQEGDIVKIVGGYVRENQGRKEVHMNDRSKVIPNPEGETIGEVKEFAASERKQINVLTEGMENIEILGTIIQAFEPRFFEVCPQCGKRTRPEGDVYPCSVHGNITPDYSYVMNAFVDDGSENIRCVFFKNQVERLLGKTQPEILLYKEDLQAFDVIKTQLLGNIIKLVGRVTKNQMFDRLEFVTQLVFTDPDPKEELKKMETSSDSTPDVPDTVKTQEEEVVSDVEKLN